jgi:hypothetical protein
MPLLHTRLVIPSPSSPVHRALICLHILTQATQYQQHCLSSINIITSISFSLHRGRVSGVSDRYSTVIPLRSSTHSSRPFRFHHKKHKLVCSHNSNKIAKHNTQFSQSLYLSDIGPYQGRGTGEYCWQVMMPFHDTSNFINYTMAHSHRLRNSHDACSPPCVCLPPTY